ncbi:MAG: hypothetical protein WD002_15840 [Pseudomonadales bacterium]
MSGVVYAIVFTGGIVDGFQLFSVKAHLSKMLKADADKMATLFSGKPVVLKRTADKQEAIRYGTALKKIGADVKIKAVKQQAQAARPAAGKPGTAPAADTSGLSLAKMEGNIVEPRPPVPAPQIDLSAFQLAENDGSPLIQPSTDFIELDIDLSGYTVSENDGSPLVEPDNTPVPEVEAPDFGLDEPGAVLETLKEEKQEVHPDVSNLSLAEVGSNLVDETDKPLVQPPKLPDTSSIQLAPLDA